MTAEQARPEEHGPDERHPEERRRAVRNRVILWVVLAVVLVLLLLLASAFVPRWWAQTVGGLVDSSFGRGLAWGLGIGVVFSLLPVLLVARAIRRWKGWKGPVVLAVVAAILAAPNLFTLWVVVGTSSAAHAAERTMDVNAPWFRGASLGGVIIGLVVGIAIELLWRGWRHRGKELKAARERQVRDRPERA